jgi:hypothetical protein
MGTNRVSHPGDAMRDNTQSDLNRHINYKILIGIIGFNEGKKPNTPNNERTCVMARFLLELQLWL